MKFAALALTFVVATTPFFAVAEGPAKPGPVVPAGSGDYKKMLALATRYKKHEITFAQLTKAVLDAKLPPHPLGDEYLVSPVPMPPPGVKFDPGMMPPDWEKTFGEVAMMMFAGGLSREDYDKLHQAAHGKRAGYPNCKRNPDDEKK